MNLHRAGRIALAGLVSALCLTAQDRISVGITGGIPVTDIFADRSFTYPVETIQGLFGTSTVIAESTGISRVPPAPLDDGEFMAVSSHGQIRVR